MSEPVGTARRTPEIPNNSHRARETLPPPAQEAESREELTAIVKGSVSTRKTPWYKKISRSIIADDATSVGDFIFTDIIGPAIRNLIYDVITGGASRTLYGSSRGIRRESSIRGGGPVSSIRSRYERMSEETSRRGPTQEQRARHDFQDVVLGDREEAVDVLEKMIEYAGRYGSVTVADFYTLCNVEGDYAARAWGWSEAALVHADIRQFRRGWLIDLPDPQPLR